MEWLRKFPNAFGTRLVAEPGSGVRSGNVSISWALDALGKGALIALESYREPLFIIDAERRLHFMNAAAKRVLRSKCGLSSLRGTLTLNSVRADSALKTYVGLQPNAVQADLVRAIRLTRPGALRDWLLIIHAIDGPSTKPHRAMFLVQAIGRTRPRAVPPHLLRDLFGLTIRECAVVTALLQSATAHEAAAQLSLSHETVRSHLKRIFRKCEVCTQAELMALVHSLSQFTLPVRFRSDAKPL